MTVVTSHQPNYLAGMSVIEKIEQADEVIWLDAVQYTHGGFTNRQRMPDGSWLTIPIDHETTSGPIREVMISEHDPHWKRRHTRTIHQHYGHTPVTDAVCDVIEATRRGGHLLDVNLPILSALLDNKTGWQFQSLISHSTHARISEQLARMVELVGGTVYLSGPSGHDYLDEEPFRERGIAVSYFDRGPLANPCVLERYRAKRAA